MVLPALRALAHIFPNQLIMVCKEGARRTFFSEIAFRKVIEVDFKCKTGKFEFCYSEVAQVIGKCDLFISLVPWRSESLNRLRQLLKPEKSVGFFSDYDIALALDFTKHSSDLAFDVPRLFSSNILSIMRFVSPPAIPAWANKDAQALIGSASGAKILVVHADTASQKMWPAERFSFVINAFLSRHSDFLVFVVGKKSLPEAERVAHQDRVVSCVGLPLETTFALIRRANVFLGVDSCMLHAADLFNVPGVGLFGPTSSAEFGFKFSRHHHVQADGTMDTIDPFNVLILLETLL